MLIVEKPNPSPSGIIITNTFIMKFFLSCCVLTFALYTVVLGQSATVHISIKKYTGPISIQDPGLRYDLKRRTVPLYLDNNGSAVYRKDISKPDYLILSFSTPSGIFKYSLFLSPGDEIFLTADLSKSPNNIVVTGKGSNNNQPEIFALTNMNVKPFNDDAAPNRVIAAINKQFLINKKILANYIKINKPSSAFIKAANYNLQYFAPLAFYESAHSNAFGKPPGQQPKWENIQDSLFSVAKLNRSDALTAYNYARLVDNFTTQQPGWLFSEYRTDPKLFYKQWFNGNASRAEAALAHAPMGVLCQKIINKYFTGKVAEYAYGQAMKLTFAEADYQSAILLFNQLKSKYPASPYIKGFGTPMAEILAKEQQKINNQIIFLPGNGSKLNTFKEVLALMKGKTVLIDMWGTWCGPCRQEIEKNAKQLHAHFKGKGVIFLYIANLDVPREAEWRKQIAYFQIEGQHILANPMLTKDIMQKTGSGSYPTYILIKKDGSYKKSKTQYPVNLNALIKEIETAG